MFKINNITYADTNQTRTDGRYPLRIGSLVDLLYFPTVDSHMLLSYVKDWQGNDKYGVLRTSPVTEIIKDESSEEGYTTSLIVQTLNSVYYFEEVVPSKE